LLIEFTRQHQGLQFILQNVLKNVGKISKVQTWWCNVSSLSN